MTAQNLIALAGVGVVIAGLLGGAVWKIVTYVVNHAQEENRSQHQGIVESLGEVKADVKEVRTDVKDVNRFLREHFAEKSREKKE